MRKRVRWISCLLWLIGFLCFYDFHVEASSLQNNPNVTFSPDGKAFTTNAGDTAYTWYDRDKTVHTGIESTVRTLNTGEHIYKSTREGKVPVGSWMVEHVPGQCIHDSYPGTTYYHGMLYGTSKCHQPHNSGWMAYCADCGERISPMLIYMNEKTAYSITDLDLNLDYYYLCPYSDCKNLEQGSGFGQHYCDLISWNRYIISYNPNRGSGQAMQQSVHMYGNETVYEGETIYASTRLSRNTYTRIGYEFAGWNTKADGSGKWYTDSQEIYNETTVNNEIIYLYAQWVKSESTIHINPNGGSYAGTTGITSIQQDYGSTYYADPAKVTPPQGYTVSFNSNGGSSIAGITQTLSFKEWTQAQPFIGKMSGNTYTFMGTQGKQDTITAAYTYNSIILPTVTKSGSSFGGWFYDASCTLLAGKSGDTITPVKNITLYAKWVELVLYAQDNYTFNSSKGAVDLSWVQADSNSKVYMLYQSRDKTNWTKISSATDISNSNSVNQSYPYSGSSGTYTVPYTGAYTITLYGAQGGNYGSYIGGYGGMVQARVFLYQGEVLTYNIGGQNGYNGGGSGSTYVKGGGCTVLSSSLKGNNFLIAGGGGGATAIQNGGNGGSTESILLTGITGGSGGSGGGGGYRGGTGGELIYHTHGDCYHYHSGNESMYGGCYTSTISVLCGTAWNKTWGFWDDDGDGYCDQCKPYNITKAQHASNSHGAWYCNTCGSTCSSTGHYKTGYALGCNKTQGQVICGKTGQTIESSKKAYGGSNYISTVHTLSYSQQSGARSGNGAMTIISENIGYQNSLSLNNVPAADYAAPDPVASASVVKQALSDTQVKVSWSAPADNGTKYYHMAKSYTTGGLQEISTSNITENTLTSKVDGYYYVINTSPGTTVTASAAKTTSAAITINLTADLQYLHVACIDKAGNLSSTTHISVGKTDPEVAWNVFTRQIGISEQESVHPSGIANTYYIKSDGITLFTLAFDSYMQGNASVSYQITRSIFEAQPGSGEAAQMNIYTKPEIEITNSEIETKAALLDKGITGNFVLQDAAYTVTKRFNWCKDLGVTQKFTLPPSMDGVKIRVTPIVGVDSGESVVYSDKSADLTNSIFLIGDSTPPEIMGLGALKDIETIDRDNENHTIVLQATDSGSGMNEFYAVITNTDNGSTKIIYSEDGSTLTLNLSEDSALFTGDFTVELHAVDNVGNERIETHGLTEFTLTVNLTRILEPHAPIFRAGESGLLTITTTGYADRVEVIFPEEMTALNPGLNTVYEYSPATYLEEEELAFMIPLYTPERDDYKIIVRAYKDGAKLEEYPRFSTIGMNGSVLDSLRKQLQ